MGNRSGAVRLGVAGWYGVGAVFFLSSALLGWRWRLVDFFFRAIGQRNERLSERTFFLLIRMTSSLRPGYQEA